MSRSAVALTHTCVVGFSLRFFTSVLLFGSYPPPPLYSSTDDPAAAFAALTTACLGALFAAPTTLDSPTFPVGPGPAAADDAHPSIREARPSKPSRRAGLSAIAKRQQKKEKQHRIRLEEWAGKGAVAPFVARLVAAKALAQLTREADHCVRSNAAPRRASAGEQPRRGTRANDVDRFGRGSETVMATPRESVLTEAAQRAGSAWAWERELAFLLVESCAGQGDERARDRSLPSRWELRCLVFRSQEIVALEVGR